MFRLLLRCRDSGLDQAMAVVTCDRCEIWCSVLDQDIGRIETRIAGLLAEAADLTEADLVPRLHHLRSAEALRYAFAVAASLESEVIGEPQVLGQVKAAHQLAGKAGLVGPDLDRVLEAAVQAAKRVRSETAIAAQSVSMAACVVAVARQMHGTLDAINGLLIGDGDMGELMVEHLRAAGLTRWTILHHNERRARAWAERQRGHWRPMAEVDQALTGGDLVITAQDAARVMIDPAMIKVALKARRRRPMLLIDAAVPGDIDPAVNEIYDAFLYGLDDLERLAMAGMQQRQDAASAAWAIIDEALAGFETQRQSLQAAPLIAELRRAFESHRVDVLAQGGALDAEEATRRLINRLLHQPITALKQQAGDPAMEALIRRLFDLREDEK